MINDICRILVEPGFWAIMLIVCVLVSATERDMPLQFLFALLAMVCGAVYFIARH